jgi:hypothetical protein
MGSFALNPYFYCPRDLGRSLMGRINVVTSFSPKGYETYGKLMLKTFNWGWPHDVRLYVYHEANIPIGDKEALAATWVNLDRDEDRAAFTATHKDRSRDHPHAYLEWPVKFCHKVFAVTSAPRDCDWIIWMDGDIETTQPITWSFLKGLLPDDVTGVYLGRRWWSHTETGFYAIRMSEAGRQFLDALRDVYTSDKIMTFTNLTDCAAFDYCLQIFEGKGHKFKDLGAGHKGPDIDVMAKSVLAPYLWHNKGDFRKLKAYGKVA